MALWSKKKISSKITKYFDDKQISYVVEEQNNTVIKFDLCFVNEGFILYPYITIDEANSIISFNVNVAECNLKNNYNTINQINQNSVYLKSFIQDEILVLEYRLKIVDDVKIVLDSIINDLYSLEKILENM